MWTERPKEELEHFVELIDEALSDANLSDLQAAQHRRVREAIVTHLTASEVALAGPELEPEAMEMFAEPTTPEAEVTEEPAEETVSEPEPTEVDSELGGEEPEPGSLPETAPLEFEESVADQIPEVLPEETQTEPEGADSEEPDNVVESGDEGLWGHARPVTPVFVYPDGSRPTNADILLRERQERRWESFRREDKIIVIRFDPELGTYNEQGRLLVDSTESPVIRKNLDVIIEVAQYIAKFSQETDLVGKEVVLSLPEILDNLGFSNLEPWPQRQLGKELARILDPTQAVSFFTTRSLVRKVQVRHAFQFIVTDLTPRRSKHRAEDITPEAVYSVVAWPQEPNDDVLCESLVRGKVPMPTNHQQAIALLGVVMDNENFKSALEDAQTAKSYQAILDIAHTMIQENLGWTGYFEARRARMIRSGKPGTSNTVRFVTGSQRNERFKKGDQAVTAPKERNLP